MARLRRGHPESWSAGLPMWGWHIAGVGLTRNALAPLGWLVGCWAIALILLIQFLETPSGTIEVTDRGAVIPPELAAVPTIFAFATGAVVGIVALRTYQQLGRTMTTRRGRIPPAVRRSRRSLGMRRPPESG